MTWMRRVFASSQLRWPLLGILAVMAACTGPGHRDDAAGILQEVAPQHRQNVVMTALSLIGSPYRNGGSTPAQGFDCSGLVNYVFSEAAGARLPRTASSQAAVSRRVHRRDLREGDLVFFNTTGRANSHVGIYIGDGRFVNAPSSGGHVRIDTLESPYFASRFNSARSVFAYR